VEGRLQDGAVGHTHRASLDGAANTGAFVSRHFHSRSKRPDVVRLLGAHTGGRNARGLALDIWSAKSEDSPFATSQLAESENTIHQLAELIVRFLCHPNSKTRYAQSERVS
jgi:hypothetical protein